MVDELLGVNALPAKPTSVPPRASVNHPAKVNPLFVVIGKSRAELPTVNSAEVAPTSPPSYAYVIA